MNKPKVFLSFVALYFIVLVATPVFATNDVSTNFSANGTLLELTAVWTEYENLSIQTGSGSTFAILSVNIATNYSLAHSYVRIKRDGIVLESFSLSQSVYPTTITYVAPYTETEGTHYYSWESYCSAGRRCQIYNRTFSLQYLNTGAFGAGGGGGNVSGVIGAPAGVLDCTGTDVITCTISPSGTNFRNDTISTHTTQISGLQSNDTEDRSYVNATFLPILTYNGNFPNATLAGYDNNFPNASLPNYLLISTYNGNYPNSSLTNYLLINTYAGNFPNSSLPNYLLISTYNGNFPNVTVAGNLANWNATYNATYDAKIGWTQTLFNDAFHTEIPVCNATTGKLVSDDGETVTCGTDQTGATGGNVSSVTAESPLTYTGTTDVVIKDERTTYPNDTLSSKEGTWDAKTTLSQVNSSALLASVTQVFGLQGYFDYFNATDDNLAGVNAAQNTSITNIQTVNTNQNTSITNIETINNAQDTSILALQVNDSYFNSSVFSNSTQFRNDSIDTKEPIISTSTANKFLGWDKTFKDILISYVSGLQDTLNSMNDTFLPIITYNGNFPNSTVAENLINWNSTYNSSYEVASINFIISNGTNVISTGIKGDVEVPFNSTITSARAFADQTGSINVSYWKDSYANFPPDASDSLGYIAISASNKAESTGLSQSVTAGDILRFNVDSVTTITRVTISLTIRRT